MPDQERQAPSRAPEPGPPIMSLRACQPPGDPGVGAADPDDRPRDWAAPGQTAAKGQSWGLPPNSSALMEKTNPSLGEKHGRNSCPEVI